MDAPVESELTVYVVYVNAPQQVCEPAAFWKLAVPSKSLWWVGTAVELGATLHWKGLPFISHTTLALHKCRPLVCAYQRKIISAESPCCEDNLQDKSMFPESSSTWFT